VPLSKRNLKSLSKFLSLVAVDFLHAPTLGKPTQLPDLTAAHGQSASQSWCQTPIWGGPRPDFSYCQDSCGFIDVGTFSDEGTALPFTIPAGPRQRSHSGARVPRDATIFLLSHIRDSPNPEGQVPPFLYTPGVGWPCYTHTQCSL
jgi:hypothetical protein